MQLPEKLMPLVADAVAVVLRKHNDPTRIMGPVRHAVGQFDPREVIYNVQTLNEVWSSSLPAPRLSMILLSVFAGLALVLACVGIHGVISYIVGQRAHEIGVCTALGAQPRDVLLLVLGHGAGMALVGTAIGVAAAFALTRLIANRLFGHSPRPADVCPPCPAFRCDCSLLLPTSSPRLRVDPRVALRSE